VDCVPRSVSLLLLLLLLLRLLLLAHGVKHLKARI
jgi:hypothetical protein